jgi:hypothetical protein
VHLVGFTVAVILNCVVRAWTGYRLCSPGKGSFEDGTVCSNSVKRPEFISKLSDYRTLLRAVGGDVQCM